MEGRILAARALDRDMIRMLCLVFALVACEKADSRTPATTAEAVVVPPGAKPPPTATTTVWHAKQLIDHPEWVGSAVTVDIVEPLYDSEHSSLPKQGEYDVEVADVGAVRLLLVPTPGHPLGILHPPLRVHGTLEEYTHGVQVAVDSVAPLPRETPAHLDRASQLLDDPSSWSGKLVEVTGDWMVGFEVSRMDRVWIDAYPDATVRCEPKRDEHEASAFRAADTYRVRVVGRAYTAGHYGHMSMSDAQIVATEIEYVDLCNKAASSALRE